MKSSIPNGKCIIVSAPSGAGKTTIVHRLLNAGLGLEFSVSATTRPKRETETGNKDYYFLSTDEFLARIENGDFLEWEEVYPGTYYGTLKSEIRRIWDLGRHVIFEVDVYGGLKLKKIFGKDSLAVFIMPPSLQILEERLRCRGSDSEESLRERLAKARQEIELNPQFDTVLVNDDLDLCSEIALKLVKEFLIR